MKGFVTCNPNPKEKLKEVPSGWKEISADSNSNWKEGIKSKGNH